MHCSSRFKLLPHTVVIFRLCLQLFFQTKIVVELANDSSYVRPMPVLLLRVAYCTTATFFRCGQNTASATRPAKNDDEQSLKMKVVHPGEPRFKGLAEQMHGRT